MKKSIQELPPKIRARIVLENDEVRSSFGYSKGRLNLNSYSQMCYNAEDLLEVCEELDVPLIFGKGNLCPATVTTPATMP